MVYVYYYYDIEGQTYLAKFQYMENNSIIVLVYRAA